MKVLLTLFLLLTFVFNNKTFAQADGCFGIFHYRVENNYHTGNKDANGKPIIYTRSVNKTGFISRPKIPIWSYYFDEKEGQRLIFGDWLGFDAGLPAILGLNGGISLANVNYAERIIICPRISFSAMISYTNKFDDEWDQDIFSVKYGMYFRLKNLGIIYDFGRKRTWGETGHSTFHNFDFRYFFGKDILRGPFLGLTFMPLNQKDDKYPELAHKTNTFMFTFGAYGLDFGSR